jgi:hypothetical protein
MPREVVPISGMTEYGDRPYFFFGVGGKTPLPHFLVVLGKTRSGFGTRRSVVTPCRPRTTILGIGQLITVPPYVYQRCLKILQVQLFKHHYTYIAMC